MIIDYDRVVTFVQLCKQMSQVINGSEYQRVTTFRIGIRNES